MFNSLLSVMSNLCDVVNAGVVDNTHSGNGIPGNVDTDALADPTGGLVITLIILLCVAVLFSIFFIYIYIKLKNKVKTANDKCVLTEEENIIITKYRQLNKPDKNLVYDTLEKLNNNPKNV